MNEKEFDKKDITTESKIENDVFDATKLDVNNSISSRVYFKGVDKEVDNFLKNDYKTKYDFDKKGIDWIYKNTRYKIEDEDLITELKNALADRNRGVVDMIRINNELPRIQSKYGKDVNLAKRMYQEAKDFYQQKLRNEKSIEANYVYIDYLISRLKEINKNENSESSLTEKKLDLTREDVIEKLKLPKEEKREWFDSLDLTNYEFAIKVMREESLKQTEKKEELTEMNFAQQVYYSNKEKYKKFKDLEWFNLKPNQILVVLISDDNKIIYEKIQNEVKSISNLYDRIFEKPDVREKAGDKVSYFVVKFKDLTDNINIPYGAINNYFKIKGLDDDLRDYFKEKKEKNQNELQEKYPEDSRLKVGDKYYLYLKTRGNKDDSNSYILFEYKGITFNANKYAYGSETIYNFRTEYISDSVKYEELDKLFENEEILTIDDFNKKFKEKEVVDKFDNDLEYLNNILSISQDLLDLISDTGEVGDIYFLKEKIKMTKDLISLINYEKLSKGGEVSGINTIAQIWGWFGIKF